MKEGFDSPTGYKLKEFPRKFSKGTSRDGAVVARRAHNPKVAGSSPAPATRGEKSSAMATFFILRQFKVLVNTGIIGIKLYFWGEMKI